MVNELEIEAVIGREILDSRGNPTVEVEVCLTGGATGCSLRRIHRQIRGSGTSGRRETIQRTGS